LRETRPVAERRLHLIERTGNEDLVAGDRDGGRGRIVALHGDDLSGDEDRRRARLEAGLERLVDRAVGCRRPDRLGDERSGRRRGGPRRNWRRDLYDKARNAPAKAGLQAMHTVRPLS
jgi:hypothetical protein